MNNGEGTRENVSEVASPDPFDPFPPKSDGGDASPASLSQYSSCGESEFERYCSANSAMGTPSVRSSFGTFNDGFDTDFGSLKSLGFGDDVNFDNFSLGGDPKISTLGDRRIEFCAGSSDGAVKVESGFSGLRLYGDNDDERGKMNSCGMVSEDKIELGGNVENVLIGGSSSNSGSGKRSLSGAGIEVAAKSELGVEEGSAFHADNGDGLHLEFGSGFDRKGMEGEEEEDGTSSRYEHSEGEDSMYNYGTDEEHMNNLYYRRNVEYRQEAESKNENPLAMNSHVAFGAEDWDDFEQEVVGSTLSSLIFDKSEEKKELNLESERKLLGLSSVTLIDGLKEQITEEVDVPAVRNKVQGADESKETIGDSMVNSAGFPNVGKTEHVEEEKDIPVASYQVQGAGILGESTKSSSLALIDSPRFSRLDQDVIVATSNQVQGTDIWPENTKSTPPTPISLPRFSGPDQDVRDISVASNQVQGAASDDVIMYDNPINDIFEVELDPLVERAPLKIRLDSIDSGMEVVHQCGSNNEHSTDVGGVSKNQEFVYFKEQLDPLAEIFNDQCDSCSIGSPIKLNAESVEACEPKLSSSTFGNIILNESQNSPTDLVENPPASTKRENLELNDSYDEVVHEMEEILLDYSESPGARFSQGGQMFHSQFSLPLRDGGSTASTSGTDYAFPLTSLPLRIDGVEVVGAKQKRGDVSLGERLVGVKEYTAYKIRVWSGNDQWEVERRYRDFFTLYRRLKSLFADQGWILPSVWLSVEKESWKIFGNVSPDVVAERSLLIQECLQSVLHSSYFSTPPAALLWFLSPQGSVSSSPLSDSLVPNSISCTRRADADSISTLGKTISLIVAVQPHKSRKQMLEAQHYTCAGCHKYFDEGTTLMRNFVQTFGWGKPRLCDYTGQLFCSSCHTNDTAVLPARVLHHWDFTRYPVSQLAKSYLDSVYDQPMLCVSAVNPFLYSKVPALQHVVSLRKKIGTMLPYVRCPFRRSINKGLGSRRYLLESNDFFALRDLIDLSKGPFAALPVMVENISRKILEHITMQCLICCDVGVPCSARQACNDPSSLIFTFQEDDIERCKSCGAVFHKRCFRKITHCPCGAGLGEDKTLSSTKRVSHGAGGEASGVSNLLVKRPGSGLSGGLLSGLFSQAKPEKTEHKESDNIILMGSLPST